MKVIIFIAICFHYSRADTPFNWLSLAVRSATDYLPTKGISDKSHWQTLCQRIIGLNPVQTAFCAQNPQVMPFIARGIREAIFECQTQFKLERWNCSDRHEVTSTPYGPFLDILGKTIRSTTKESAFLTAISSASIVHSITKGCNTGNITDCSCDTKPALQRNVHIDPRDDTNLQFSWGGCSDNVPHAIKLARKFLDDWETKKFEETKDVKHLVAKHNNFVGREAIGQNIIRQCRCHGVSGSCEFRTCWLSVIKFSEIAEMLKKRYEHFSVQVTKKAKKRLRRKERSERQIPLRGNEMAYVQRSPSYCERNDTAGVLGTIGRECTRQTVSVDNCDLMCCGRGYNTRIERKKSQCHCKFVWCCQVKCKECIEDVQVNTCK